MKLYRLIQTNTETGNSGIVYGHVTINVILEYLAAWVDETHTVTVKQLTEEDLDSLNKVG
jgi:hypothetical protein